MHERSLRLKGYEKSGKLSTLLSFDKMEGIGNDFLVTHTVAAGAVDKIASMAKIICDRRKGVGADGIIFVLPSEKNDFRMRIINSDGSEPEMCGNGIRCFARYVFNHGLSDSTQLCIDTLAGSIITENKKDRVKVTMGVPRLLASEIPFAKGNGTVIQEKISVKNRDFLITAVSMGNPHAVIFADDLTDDLVLGYGPLIEQHALFPKKTNVEFIKVLSSSEIDMRVYERGCGETQACGTGACAATVACILNSKCGNDVTVHLPGGDLKISWDGNPLSSVFLEGSARLVYRGEMELHV